MKTSLRVLGQEHPDTLTSMANLASTYRNQERCKEAEVHPDTVSSLDAFKWVENGEFGVGFLDCQWP
jgi:hypothetical protein